MSGASGYLLPSASHASYQQQRLAQAYISDLNVSTSKLKNFCMEQSFWKLDACIFILSFFPSPTPIISSRSHNWDIGLHHVTRARRWFLLTSLMLRRLHFGMLEVGKGLCDREMSFSNRLQPFKSLPKHSVCPCPSSWSTTYCCLGEGVLSHLFMLFITSWLEYHHSLFTSCPTCLLFINYM